MKKLKRIYLDTAAGFGNPSSLHEEGVAARAALDRARARVAEILGAHPDEIIFTSGGTEANNLAIFGIGGPVLAPTIGHASVLAPLEELKRRGQSATFFPVPENGLIDPKEIKKSLTPEIKLVTITYADSEIGTIQPVREIAKVLRQATPRPLLHLDACQAGRFLDLNVARLGVDLMTLNGSKIYGPKGVGCLYARRGVPLQPILFGGGQERGLRAGTENVPGIIDFAEALTICQKLKEAETKKLTALRERLWRGLQKINGVKLNGHETLRLPDNLNVSFADVEAEQLVIELDAKGVACSAGSACSSNKADVDARDIIGVRFSLGRETTVADINYVIKILPSIISKLRNQNNYVSNSSS